MIGMVVGTAVGALVNPATSDPGANNPVGPSSQYIGADAHEILSLLCRLPSQDRADHHLAGIGFRPTEKRLVQQEARIHLCTNVDQVFRSHASCGCIGRDKNEVMKWGKAVLHLIRLTLNYGI